MIKPVIALIIISLASIYWPEGLPAHLEPALLSYAALCLAGAAYYLIYWLVTLISLNLLS